MSLLSPDVRDLVGPHGCGAVALAVGIGCAGIPFSSETTPRVCCLRWSLMQLRLDGGLGLVAGFAADASEARVVEFSVSCPACDLGAAVRHVLDESRMPFHTWSVWPQSDPPLPCKGVEADCMCDKFSGLDRTILPRGGGDSEASFGKRDRDWPSDFV